MKTKNICNIIQPYATENIEIFQFIYETDSSVMKSPIRLSCHRLLLIKQGNGNLNADEFSYAFNTGYLFFLFADECFSINGEEGCEYMYIDFSGTRADILFKRFGINKSNRLFKNFDGLIPLWYNSLSGASLENSDLASESMLLYTFSHLIENTSSQNNILNKMLEITQTHFTNPNLSLSYVAEKLSYNSKYLSHLFKSKIGVGYAQYLKSYRIKYAITLLEHGIDSVKNVSLLSGFQDPLYFSKVFKESVGVSPKNFKKSTANKS